MKEVIKKIFNDYNFEEQKITLPLTEEVFFAVNFNDECLNFYLVVFIDQIDDEFLENQVLEYYKAIKGLEIGYDERMDKNLSLLVCLRNDNEISSTGLQKKIFEIEEDPYFFKKYVFTYNDVQREILSDYFNSPDTHSRRLLNNIVNDNELFISFKKNPNDNSNNLYSLCSKLLIKLPFIVFERDEKEIEDLSEKIKGKLQDESLLEYSNGWLNVRENNDGYNINDILEVLEGDEHNDEL